MLLAAAFLVANIQAALDRAKGDIILPPGETRIDRPLVIPKGARGLKLRGAATGSILVMNPGFQGSAAIKVDGASEVTLSGFEIRGNRTELKSPWYLPLKEAAFADFYPDNGILIRNTRRIIVRNVRLSAIRAFAVLVSASANVTLDALRISDSGTLNQAGRNNTTGGILIEEGVATFEIVRCVIERITGNGIWTHSYARSPRQSDGWIHANSITTVGRDAIQVGHGTRVRVEDNQGSELGFPVEIVDVESHGVAVALDTAGNVDHSTYARNHFTDVNGQCIDLDGFHDGQVRDNSCVNRKPLEAYPASHYGIVFGNNDPGMEPTGVIVTGNRLEGFAYGGVFLVGSNNRIQNNRLLDLNRAHCGSTPTPARCNYALDQPDLLRSGVYIASNGGRPAAATANIVTGNEISGYGISGHCVAAAPGIELAANTTNPNQCGPK